MNKKVIDEQTQLLKYTETETITISDYKKLQISKDKGAISDFVFKRLYSRYLRPSEETPKEYKNGFAIMANCCLLIETLQSFKNGWGDTKNKSEAAFKDFFTSDDNFKELKGLSSDFYKNVRCGILHQGETTNGWKINRKGDSLIFDIKNKTIDAIRFSELLKKSLQEYSESLEKSEWDSQIWDNFRVKMRKIIDNCAA